jgi:hypothetical protein
MKPLASLLTAVLLAGCAAPQPIDPGEESRNVRITVGIPGCDSCSKLKTFVSGVIDKQAYNHAPVHLWSDYRLVATNRKVNATSYAPRAIDPVRASAPALLSSTPSGEPSRPYRVAMRVSINYGAINPTLYLINKDGEYVGLPQAQLEGIGSRLSCFQSGCIDTGDYVLPGEEIDRAIAQQLPIRLFLGTRVRTEVPSKNGFDRSSEMRDVGVKFLVQPAHVKAFLDQVRANL